MNLSAAGNVLVPAYLVLLAKGYAVERTVSADHDVWRARKGDNEFVAYSPLEVLGVVGVGEERGESWQATDQQIEEFLHRFP